MQDFEQSYNFKGWQVDIVASSSLHFFCYLCSENIFPSTWQSKELNTAFGKETTRS